MGSKGLEASEGELDVSWGESAKLQAKQGYRSRERGDGSECVVVWCTWTKAGAPEHPVGPTNGAASCSGQAR